MRKIGDGNMDYINTPIYDHIQVSEELNFVMADEDRNKYVSCIKGYVDSFLPDDMSYDSYCCHLSLFAAYCFAHSTTLALATLAKLEQFPILDYHRHLEHIIACLTDLGEIGLARQYARRMVEMIRVAVHPPKRAVALFSSHHTWLLIICEHDPFDCDVPLLLAALSSLAGSQYSFRDVTDLFDILMPLNLVPASGMVILQSVWAFMKCDEAFGGNNYQDELVKIEAWLAQLSNRT